MHHAIMYQHHKPIMSVLQAMPNPVYSFLQNRVFFDSCVIIQGSYDSATDTYRLFDPTVHCISDSLRFTITSMGDKGMQGGFRTHICISECKRMGLQSPDAPCNEWVSHSDGGPTAGNGAKKIVHQRTSLKEEGVSRALVSLNCSLMILTHCSGSCTESMKMAVVTAHHLFVKSSMCYVCHLGFLLEIGPSCSACLHMDNHLCEWDSKFIWSYIRPHRPYSDKIPMMSCFASLYPLYQQDTM
jgi:hypothetical protein